MHTNGLNSLEYAQRLKAAGVPPEQAEVQASILYEIINSNLVNKQDLANTDLKIENVRANLKRDIEELRTELKRDIKELDLKIENTKTELKRDIKEIEGKITSRITIASGACAFLVLTSLITLFKLGLMTPVVK